jgi:hypothetical protein
MRGGKTVPGEDGAPGQTVPGADSCCRTLTRTVWQHEPRGREIAPLATQSSLKSLFSATRASADTVFRPLHMGQR